MGKCAAEAAAICGTHLFQALLHVRPIHRGVMEFRSEATGLYLCMNKNGKVYASCNRSSECEFVPRLEKTYYDTLQSRRFSGRYLAISTSGRIKRARRVQGHLGKENFFLYRLTQIQEARRIIERYQKRLLGQLPQRCDGYNEYNMTTAGSDSERGRGGVATLAPTVGPTAYSTPTTTTTTPTTTSQPFRRPCRIIKGKKRCETCTIVKGKKKCRKRQKRCKNKKCRERRKQRKDRQRQKQRQERGSREVNTTVTVSIQAPPHTRKVTGTGKTRPRQHRKPARPRQQPRYTAITVTPQVRRPRKHHLPTQKPTHTRDTPRVSSGPPWPTPRTTQRTEWPFPPAPSPARPYSVRHAHDTRRRRPRGHLIPPTSTDV
ncbi:protein let-756-like isoform X2 [Cherax quadricarinatus]|uniref:protein let-756-like isoform X2 n=1 Tax=Cherax quadricarinatus TaxID=27406 RepID=UPI00387E5937